MDEEIEEEPTCMKAALSEATSEEKLVIEEAVNQRQVVTEPKPNVE